MASSGFNHPGYRLDYRRLYFTTAYSDSSKIESVSDSKTAVPSSPDGDILQRNIKHGAPIVHDLLPANQSQTSSTGDLRSQEFKFYGNAQPYLDKSVSLLKKTVPDLDGLKAEASQEGLHDTLTAAAANLSGMVDKFPDLVSSDVMAQTEWAASSTPLCTGMSGCVERHSRREFQLRHQRKIQRRQRRTAIEDGVAQYCSTREIRVA